MTVPLEPTPPADPFDAEPKIGLQAAAKLLPGLRGDNTHINPSTLFRWITEGVRVPGGRVCTGRVYLRAARIGGRWCTTAGALARFSAELTAAKFGQLAEEGAYTPAEIPRSPAARARSAQRAAAELEAAGA